MNIHSIFHFELLGITAKSNLLLRFRKEITVEWLERIYFSPIDIRGRHNKDVKAQFDII
jgi:hypothetical protein